MELDKLCIRYGFTVTMVSFSVLKLHGASFVAAVEFPQVLDPRESI